MFDLSASSSFFARLHERILIYQSEKKKRVAFEYDFLDANAAH